MFKVVTKNSVYSVRPCSMGFEVWRSADMWGRRVLDSHFHLTPRIYLAVGEAFETSGMTTTAVLAVIEG